MTEGKESKYRARERLGGGPHGGQQRQSEGESSAEAAGQGRAGRAEEAGGQACWRTGMKGVQGGHGQPGPEDMTCQGRVPAEEAWL